MDGPGHTAIFFRLDSLIRSLVSSSLREQIVSHPTAPDERLSIVARMLLLLEVEVEEESGALFSTTDRFTEAQLERERDQLPLKHDKSNIQELISSDGKDHRCILMRRKQQYSHKLIRLS